MKITKTVATITSLALLCGSFTGCEKTCVFNFSGVFGDVKLSKYDKFSCFRVDTAEDEFNSDNLEFISENPEIATFEFDTATGKTVYYKITPISDGKTDIYVKCKACGSESKKIHVVVDGAPEHEEKATTTTITTTTTEETTTTTATTTEKAVTTNIATTVAPVPSEGTNGYTLMFGELLSVIENNIDGKNVLVVKAKITSSLTNTLTIDQNYHNVEDLIENQGCDQYDEIQYWAVADMTDDSERKVISFKVGSDLIQQIKNNTVSAPKLGDYVSDLYILPSLLE